jgi:hypothetical protein
VKGDKIQSLELGIERKLVLVFHNESAGATNYKRIILSMFCLQTACYTKALHVLCVSSCSNLTGLEPNDCKTIFTD